MRHHPHQQPSNHPNRPLEIQSEEVQLSQTKKSLNQRRAEELWGKQVHENHNLTICKNSLPRQRLVPAQKENKVKMERNLHRVADKLDFNVEIISDTDVDVDDIAPLVVEAEISSPSLFNSSPAESSHTSSPLLTVQKLF